MPGRIFVPTGRKLINKFARTKSTKTKRMCHMQETPLDIIDKQTAKLSLHDHIKLLEPLTRQLREKSNSARHDLDWSELYGLGKGLWKEEDAQDYINRIREDRG